MSRSLITLTVTSFVFCVSSSLVTGQIPDLRLPFSEGECWLLKQGYYNPSNPDATTHRNYGAPWKDDRFALDFTLLGCDSWRKPILASSNGTVELAEIQGGWGKTVIMDHGSGYKTRYSHLETILVSVGDQIFQGQIVGKCGNTGNVFGEACPEHPGTHLHFALYHNGEGVRPEPMSGFTNFVSFATAGDCYTSDNTLLETGLIGQFENPVAGTEGVSNAFIRAYNSFQQSDGHNPLGQSGGPDGFYPYVFAWGNSTFWIQQFHNADRSKPYFGDGTSRLYYNPEVRKCFLIYNPLLSFYQSHAGVDTYGAPTTDVISSWFNPDINIGQGSGWYLRQDFAKNKSLVSPVGCNPSVQSCPVFVYDTSDLSHVSYPEDFSIAGISGKKPLTLQGWAITKDQCSFSWSGEVSFETGDFYELVSDNTLALQTTLNEATFTGLLPGSTHTYVVRLVNNTYRILEQSETLVVTQPEDQVFSLHADLDGLNSAYLWIENSRFPVINHYAFYRNGSLIATSTGNALSDYPLSYNTTYQYVAKALTSSNLILGTSSTVSLTTKSAPNLPAQRQVWSPPIPEVSLALETSPLIHEQTPRHVDGNATVTCIITNPSDSPIGIERFEAKGVFTDQYGSIYTKYWRSDTFANLHMQPGETYTYSASCLYPFPSLPTTAVVEIMVKVAGFAGTWPIESTLDGSPAFVSFACVDETGSLFPNLFPSLVLPEGQLTSDDDVLINIIIHNGWLTKSAASGTDVLVDGVFHSHYTVPELPSGGRHNFSVNLGRLLCGTHEIKVIADINDEVTENTEEDNRMQRDIEIHQAPRPNLTLSVGSPTSVITSSSFDVTYSVLNDGDASSIATLLDCGFGKIPVHGSQVSESDRAQYAIPAIAPNECVEFTLSQTLSVEGLYSLWASVDLINEMPEHHESDNDTSRTLTAYASIEEALLVPISVFRLNGPHGSSSKLANENGIDTTALHERGDPISSHGFDDTVDGSYYLDGSSFLSVPNHPTTKVMDGWSVMMVFKPEGVPSLTSRLLECRDGEKGFGLHIKSGSGTLRVVTGDGVEMCPNGSEGDTNATVCDGQWHSALVCFNGVTSKIYLDGKLLKHAVLKPIVHPNTETRVGTSGPDNGYSFVGYIDEVSFFNEILTDENVAALWAATSQISLTSESPNTVMAEWRFSGTSDSPQKLAEINGQSSLSAFLHGNPQNFSGFDGSTNGAWFLNGQSFLEIPFHPNSRIQDGCSIELWVKKDRVPQVTERIIECKSVESGWGLHVKSASGTLRVVSGDGVEMSSNNGEGDTDAFLCDNQWHLITVNFASSQSAIFVDGQFVKQACLKRINAPNTPVMLGMEGHGAGYGFYGCVDDVRFYRSLLNEQEVLSRWNAAFEIMSSDETVSSEPSGTSAVWYMDGPHTSGLKLENSQGVSEINIIPSGAVRAALGYDTVTDGAFWLDGQSFLSIPDYFYSHVSDGWTVELWFRTAFIPSRTARLIESRNGEKGFGIHIRSNDGCLRIVSGDGVELSPNNGQGDIATFVCDDQWHYAAVYFNGPNSKIFVDGQLVKTCSLKSINPSNTPIRIGVDGGGNDLFFSGVIDELRLSNVERTADEIRRRWENAHH